jgi:hypothetical protein
MRVSPGRQVCAGYDIEEKSGDPDGECYGQDELPCEAALLFIRTRGVVEELRSPCLRQVSLNRVPQSRLERTGIPAMSLFNKAVA